MRHRKRKASLIVLIIALVVGYFAGLEPRELMKLLEQFEQPETNSTAPAPSRPTSPHSTSSSSPDTQSTNSHGYTRLENCHLVKWGGNDGDSFKVRHSGDTYVFRLYFVDTPESNFRFPDRVGHQARYFKTSREKAVQVGKDAKVFTRNLLENAPFTVETRWENVMKSERLHGFVITRDGRYLSEQLVENGLARIYTMPADLPDGTPKKTFKRHLQDLERQARAKSVGGWR